MYVCDVANLHTMADKTAACNEITVKVKEELRIQPLRVDANDIKTQLLRAIGTWESAMAQLLAIAPALDPENPNLVVMLVCLWCGHIFGTMTQAQVQIVLQMGMQLGMPFTLRMDIYTHMLYRHNPICCLRCGRNSPFGYPMHTQSTIWLLPVHLDAMGRHPSLTPMQLQEQRDKENLLYMWRLTGDMIKHPKAWSEACKQLGLFNLRALFTFYVGAKLPENVTWNICVMSIMGAFSDAADSMLNHHMVFGRERFAGITAAFMQFYFATSDSITTNKCAEEVTRELRRDIRPLRKRNLKEKKQRSLVLRAYDAFVLLLQYTVHNQPTRCPLINQCMFQAEVLENPFKELAKHEDLKHKQHLLKCRLARLVLEQ